MKSSVRKTKIIVIGSPGSGKSTFAQKLANITNLPIYHLDMLWNKANKTTITREDFELQLSEILKEEMWIIDGNYQRTLEMRLKECNTVFLLDYPIEVCLSGAKSRIGKKREDFPYIEEKLDKEFEQKIINFSKDKLPRIYELLKEYEKNRKIVIFKSRKEANDYLKGMKEL